MSTAKRIKTRKTPGNSATNNYVNRLPELVLDEIFDILKYEPETLVSCRSVSNLWDGVLWTKKTEFMFSSILPFVVKRLSREDIFSCRLACRTWKLGVDRLNDQVPPWNPRIESTYNWIMRGNFRGLALSGFTRFGYNERCNMKDFLNCKNKKTWSPFPAGCVAFRAIFPINSNADSDELLDPDEIAARYGEGENLSILAESLRSTNYFHEILRDFGTHISHLVYGVRHPSAIYYNLQNVNLDFSPKYLVRMLNCVPNLRSLTIMYIESRCTQYWNGPHPVLPNLVSLTLGFNRSVPVITEFLFSAYGSQLHTLECLDEDLFLPQINDRISPFAFPNLKNLKLDSSPSSNSIALRNYGDHFMKLHSSVIAPCLERLSIELFHAGIHCTTLLNTMRGLSGAFSSSLGELYVEVVVIREKCGCADRGTPSMMNDAAVGVNFPRLTNFHINITHTQSPLVWCILTNIPLLPALEEFHIMSNRDLNLTDEERQRIWSILPNLRSFYFGERIETRQEAKLHVAHVEALR